MLNQTERSIIYFQYCGEINTEQVLQIARSRCDELRLDYVIIASETGRSALKALEVFEGSETKLVVVTHYPATTWGPKGKIPIGLRRSKYAESLDRLVESGSIVVQGTRPFAPPSRSLDWDAQTPEALIDKTLEVFGAGTKIAIEASVMVTDAGEIPEGEDVISCGGTFKGLDTALLVRTAYSMNFFKSFLVQEILAKPICRVTKLPEHEFKDWKGDLDQYYE